MKKIDVLVWGVKHIATNRDLNYSTDYEEDRTMSVLGDSVPLLADMSMLCENLGIERGCCYADHSWGVTIIDLDVDNWLEEHGHENYVPCPALETWKRYNVEIGS